MIAFAKPPARDFARASCAVLPVPEACPCSGLKSSLNFTITFSGLPERFTCDVCEAERIKQELIERGLI